MKNSFEASRQKLFAFFLTIKSNQLHDQLYVLKIIYLYVQLFLPWTRNSP